MLGFPAAGRGNFSVLLSQVKCCSRASQSGDGNKLFQQGRALQPSSSGPWAWQAPCKASLHPQMLTSGTKLHTEHGSQEESAGSPNLTPPSAEWRYLFGGGLTQAV